MRLRVSPLLLGVLTACTANPTGRWVGRVGDPCPGSAVLNVGRGQAVFVRDEGSQILRGTVAPDGQVSTRLETRGADKKGFVQTFEGQVHGNTAAGTYTSPRCTAAPVTMREG